jgi:hypothetical protein
MKSIQGLFWVKEAMLITIVLVSIEAGIPLTH